MAITKREARRAVREAQRVASKRWLRIILRELRMRPTRLAGLTGIPHRTIAGILDERVLMTPLVQTRIEQVAIAHDATFRQRDLLEFSACDKEDLTALGYALHLPNCPRCMAEVVASAYPN